MITQCIHPKPVWILLADVPGVIITVIKYLAVCFAFDNRERCMCFLVLHSNMLMKRRWEMGWFINTVLACLLYFLCQFKLAQSVWQKGTMSCTCCDYLSAVGLLRHWELTWCSWWKMLDFFSLLHVADFALVGDTNILRHCKSFIIKELVMIRRDTSINFFRGLD